MEKPIKPQQPEIKNYPREERLTDTSKWILDNEQYRKDIQKYNIDFAVWEQLRLIKLIKNANPDYILKNYHIEKRV